MRLPQYVAAPHFIVSSDLLWTAPAVLAATLAEHYPLLVRLHPLPMPLPEFEVALYWHDRHHHDPANKWLREFVAAQLTPLGKWPGRQRAAYTPYATSAWPDRERGFRSSRAGPGELY